MASVTQPPPGAWARVTTARIGRAGLVAVDAAAQAAGAASCIAPAAPEPAWAIVRWPMGRVSAWRAAGVLWVLDLAPSAGLLKWWRDAMRVPATDPAALWSEYRARWAEEKAASPPYRAAVEMAAAAATLVRGAGGTLTVACWCADGERCHRSIVAADVRAVLGGR